MGHPFCLLLLWLILPPNSIFFISITVSQTPTVTMLNNFSRLRTSNIIKTKHLLLSSIPKRSVISNIRNNAEILLNKGGGSEATFNYLMKYGNRFVPHFEEIIDLTKERFPGEDYLITSPDQLYFFKWLMPIIKCKVKII